MPDFVSVTIDDDEEEEEEEENLPTEPSEEHIENAKILLGRNGNTIKKMIKNLNKN